MPPKAETQTSAERALPPQDPAGGQGQRRSGEAPVVAGVWEELPEVDAGGDSLSEDAAGDQPDRA